MSKVTVLISLIVLMTGFLLWFNSANEILDALKNTIPPAALHRAASSGSLPTIKEISNINSNLQPKASPAKSLPTRQDASTPRQKVDSRKTLERIAVLESQLEEAKAELLLRQQTLQTLRQELGKSASLSGSSTGQQIENETAQIQNLTISLESARAAENNISRRVDVSMALTRDRLRAEQIRLDDQIRKTQTALRKTESEIAVWQHQKNDLTARDVRLSELNSQRLLLSRDLEAMREQRFQLSSAAADQNQAVASTALAEQQSLIQSQQAVQDELQARRERIRQLQSAQTRANESTEALQAQIEEARTSVSQQERRIAEMTQTISQLRSTLNSR